jgi:hypothetical protein
VNIEPIAPVADRWSDGPPAGASDRSAKTTGSMLPVDGGLREAFPR